MIAKASRGDLFVASKDALDTAKLKTVAKTGAAIESAILPGLNLITPHLSLQNRVFLESSLRDLIRR